MHQAPTNSKCKHRIEMQIACKKNISLKLHNHAARILLSSRQRHPHHRIVVIVVVGEPFVSIIVGLGRKMQSLCSSATYTLTPIQPSRVLSFPVREGAVFEVHH